MRLSVLALSALRTVLPFFLPARYIEGSVSKGLSNTRTSTMPNFRPLFRASLPPTRPAPGYVPTTFTRPIKKLVLEYCDTWGSNEGMRRFIKSSDGIVKLAKENPSVEVVVRKRNYKHPIVRGLYREYS